MSTIRLVALVVSLLIFSAASVVGQQGGQTGGGGTGGTGGTGGSTGGTGSTGGVGTTRPTISTQPRQPTQDRQVQETPIFLSGRVVTEDGVPPPERAVIERVCNGMVRREGYTDSKGYFSIQLGQSFGIMQDASVGTFDMSGMPTMRSTTSPGTFGSSSATALLGCELRASLPGYRSESVNLTGRRPLDHPDIGMIVLHPYGKVEGTIVSATSLQAPRDAKKALEKGRDYAKKSKWEQAQQELQKAVQVYPKYAEAWYELGVACQRQAHAEEARKAYAEAIAADSKFIRPYFQLAHMAALNNKWQEVADLTDKALALNAYEYPAAYFYNSVAYYNLHKLDLAEKSARRAKRMDSEHRIPRIDLLLSNILAERKDYDGAAGLLRDYLKFAPPSPDTEAAKTQLANIEKILATANAAPGPK